MDLFLRHSGILFYAGVRVSNKYILCDFCKICKLITFCAYMKYIYRSTIYSTSIYYIY